MGADKPLPRARARELGNARARGFVAFCGILSYFVEFCRWREEGVVDWGLQDGSLWLWFRWSGHGSRIVRGFCFVKCDAGEIDDWGLSIEDWRGVTGTGGRFPPTRE